MKNIMTLGAAIIASCLATGAQAAGDLSYNYAEIQYISASPLSGYGVEGSYVVADNIYVNAGYNTSSSSLTILTTTTAIDTNAMVIGGGYYDKIDAQTTWHAGIYYISANTTTTTTVTLPLLPPAVTTLKVTTSTVAAIAGVRYLIQSGFEVGATLSSESTFALKGLYRFADNMGGTLNIVTGGYSIGLRYIM